MTELPQGMFAQTSPCRDCPFRKEGGVRHSFDMMASYIGYFVGHPPATFPCHRTVPRDDPRTQWSAWREGQTICAGGLLFMKKQGIENALMQYARERGFFDPSKLEGEELVFDSVQEMLAAAK